jgi:hypothetical protein
MLTQSSIQTCLPVGREHQKYTLCGLCIGIFLCALCVKLHLDLILNSF